MINRQGLATKLAEFKTRDVFYTWQDPQSGEVYISHPVPYDLLYPFGCGEKYYLTAEVADSVMESTTLDCDLYSALRDSGLSMESCLVASLEYG